MIEITTGSEWHTSYGAYGFVKVLRGGATLEHHYKLSGSSTDWDNVDEIGNHGKHGKWFPSQLLLNAGAILYCEGADTYKGYPSSKGRGWFIVDPAAPKIEITTPGYSGRCLKIIGNLRQLSWQEQTELVGYLPIVRRSKWLSVQSVQNEK